MQNSQLGLLQYLFVWYGCPIDTTTEAPCLWGTLARPSPFSIFHFMASSLPVYYGLILYIVLMFITQSFRLILQSLIIRIYRLCTCPLPHLGPSSDHFWAPNRLAAAVDCLSWRKERCLILKHASFVLPLLLFSNTSFISKEISVSSKLSRPHPP